MRLQASDHNNAGNFDSAKQCGNMALGCNICAIVKYIILLLVGVALVIVYFTVGFSWLIAAKSKAEDVINNHSTDCIQSCTTDLWGYQTCHQVCY